MSLYKNKDMTHQLKVQEVLLNRNKDVLQICSILSYAKVYIEPNYLGKILFKT